MVRVCPSCGSPVSETPKEWQCENCGDGGSK